MRIVFISKENQKFYTETIDRLVSIAIHHKEFDLAEDAVDLLNDICGLDGLNYARQMSYKRLKELAKELAKSEEE